MKTKNKLIIIIGLLICLFGFNGCGFNGYTTPVTDGNDIRPPLINTNSFTNFVPLN